MTPVQVFVLDRHDALDDEGAGVLGADHPGNEMDAFENGRPVLGRRAPQCRMHADENIPRLVEEPEKRCVARLLFLGSRESKPGLEARVVHGGHELLRKERAHRLTNEVRRGHTRDPEPVGGLGRDRRLPGARRAAHEEEKRFLQPCQSIQPT